MMIPLNLLWGQSGSGQMHGDQQQVNRLDADERNNQASQAVNQQIAAQQHSRAHGTVLDALERQRDQEHDDQRVENHRRQNGR